MHAACGFMWQQSVELQGDTGEDFAPLTAPSIYPTMMTYGVRREGGESFMGINGIIK